MELLDSSYNLISFPDGNNVVSHGTVNEAFIASFETYFANTGVNNAHYFANFRQMYRDINNSDYIDFTKFVLFCPIINFPPPAPLYAITGSLTPSGDYTSTIDGISGAGSQYFASSFDPSVDITDHHNFSIGLIVTGGTGTGYDFASTDGSKTIGIQVNDGASCNMYAGTGGAASFANADMEGYYILNVLDAEIKAYKDGVDSATIALSGTLPAVNPTLGCLNTSSSYGSYSSKIYGFLWVYNGPLTTYGVGYMTNILRTFLNINSRIYG